LTPKQGILAPEAGTELAPVRHEITQDSINRYAQASGDHNPLHIDPEFAATTRFGGTIAHGMLILAFASEMLTSAFGERWINGGRLKIRFRGAARPGDTVTAAGHVASVSDGKITCSITCSNQSGETLMSGEAEMPV
jgi:3-hydroxybutyryl-CoA dehydratase